MDGLDDFLETSIHRLICKKEPCWWEKYHTRIDRFELDILVINS